MDETTCKEIMNVMRTPLPSMRASSKPLTGMRKYWHDAVQQYVYFSDAEYMKLIQEIKIVNSCTEQEILEYSTKVDKWDPRYVPSAFAMMRTKFNCVYSEISGCNVNFLDSNHEWRQQSVEHRDGNHNNNSPDNIYCACKSCNVSVRGGDLSWEGQVQKFVRKNKKHEMEREIHRFNKS